MSQVKAIQRVRQRTSCLKSDCAGMTWRLLMLLDDEGSFDWKAAKL